MALQSGVYYIQNLGSGTVLDLSGGSSTDGTKIQGYAQRPLTDVWVPAQLWVVALVEGSNTFTLQNACARTYADIQGGNIANGTPLVGFEGTSQAEQRWVITLSTNNTSYVIQNKTSGTYVDLQSGSTANGATIQIWGSEGPTTTNKNQLWNFVRV
ncbi:ricin B-like lectin [Irpex rosettiformis]|uniref:Ricin B-like lectin n=1 Tax=Irpex rosettiformis TaxID=378272 RepID=A0ACB8U884_9APHY|nr:ricin B-like lectin [Irpex rosettiformis]